jgi:hypothetical protein
VLFLCLLIIVVPFVRYELELLFVVALKHQGTGVSIVANGMVQKSGKFYQTFVVL